jgi:RNAse (barnase) inhibitor barstar
MTKVYVLDGTKIHSFESFFDEITRVIIPRLYWGRNLDAFNDILRGGFGTPEVGFTIRWVSSNISKIRLDNGRQSRVPSNFDLLVEIIRRHGPGGTESGSNVVLILD